MMKRAPIKANPTAEYMRGIFWYDLSAGALFYKGRRGVVHGIKAGCVGSHGYVVVKAYRIPYLAHRIAWLIMTGEWPEQEVDHINGNKADNRWDNLRLATHGQNVANSGARRGGLKGAYWHKRSSRWQSQIWDHGRIRHLGYFDNERDAHLAYVNAAQTVFGEFANAGAA
jgi:hypothetical protein